ncbi:hypothetical protein ACFL5F_08860, partial [Planctomycetota bacterium]
NPLDDAPLRRLKRFPIPPDACVIMAFHGVLILCLYPAAFKQHSWLRVSRPPHALATILILQYTRLGVFGEINRMDILGDLLTSQLFAQPLGFPA